MAERIDKQILELEFRTTGEASATESRAKLDGLQKAANEAQGDILKLVEAEKALEREAAKVNVAVESQTKKQTEYSKAVSESGKQISALSKISEAAVSSTKNLDKSISDLNKKLTESSGKPTAVKNLSKEVDELTKKLNSADTLDKIGEVRKEFSNLYAEMMEGRAAFDPGIIEGYNQALDQSYKRLQSVNTEEKKVEVQTQKNTKAKAGLIARFKEYITASRAAAVATRVFTTIFGAAMTLGFGVAIQLAIKGLREIGSLLGYGINRRLDEQVQKVRDVTNEVERQTQAYQRQQAFLEAIGVSEEERLNEIIRRSEESIKAIDRQIKEEERLYRDSLKRMARLSAVSIAGVNVNISGISKEDLNNMRKNIDELVQRQMDLAVQMRNAENRLAEIPKERQKRLKEEARKEQDLRLKELNERERHALAIARIEDKTNKEQLQIQLNFAKQRLAILRSMENIDQVQIKQAQNNVLELTRTIEGVVDGSIEVLREKVAILMNQAVRAVATGSDAAVEAIAKWRKAKEELEQAEKIFDASEDLVAGSLKALQKQAADLRQIIDNLPENEELLDKAKQLQDVEKQIQRLQDIISGKEVESRSATLLELLDEEERYQQQVLELAEATEAEKLANQIEFQKRRLKLLRQEGSEASEIEILRAENDLSIMEDSLEKMKNVANRTFKDILKTYIDGFGDVINSAIHASNVFIDIKQRENDRLRELQEERIDTAREIAERGNTQILEEEIKRMQRLEDERKKFAKAQAAIAQIEIVANTAVAVAKAAAEGGGVASAFTISALLIAMAAGFAQARAQAQSAGQFWKGGYVGDGGKYEKKGDVHGGEFVIDKETTQELGLRNKSMSDFRKMLSDGSILKGMVLNRKPNSELFGKQQTIVINNNKDIVAAIERIPGVQINMNSRGIISLTEQHNKWERRRKSLRR